MERHTTELDVVLGAVLQYTLRGRRNVIYTQNHLPTQEHAMKDWASCSELRSCGC